MYDFSAQLQLYAVRLSLSLERTIFEKLLAYVPSDKQEKVLRYIHYEDAQRCLLANVLSRVVLCSQYHYTNNQLSLLMDKNDYGKPFIKGQPVHFNLSHSGSWVVLAVDQGHVGVDVERMKIVEMDIARRFFSPHEYLDLLRKPFDERLDYFYSLWTLKESYIKADGKGLSIPLNSFWFRIHHEKITFQSNTELTSYHFKQYEIDESYKLSICAKHKNFPDTFTEWNETELIERAIRALSA